MRWYTAQPASESGQCPICKTCPLKLGVEKGLIMATKCPKCDWRYYFTRPVPKERMAGPKVKDE